MIETPIYIFITDKNHIVKIEEGSGEQLLSEDRAEGYIDYINIDSYILDDDKNPEDIDLEYIDDELDEFDGGIMMLKTYFSDTYTSEEDLISAVLEYQYDDANIEYRILKN